MSKFNFNIDIESNDKGNLSKSKYNSITQKQMYELQYTVDLGLPSETLWCKYNLGCDYELLNKYPENTTPKDWYGDYYAWGETKTKSEYTEKTYKWKLKSRKDGGKRMDSIYNSNLTELQPQDDAAYQNTHLYAYTYRTPTKANWEELIKYATPENIQNFNDIDGLNGTVFRGKNGTELFLPKAGYYNDKSNYKLSYDGTYGEYWSSTLYVFDEQDDEHEVYDDAYLVTIDNINMPNIHHWDRYDGYSIRPVFTK